MQFSVLNNIVLLCGAVVPVQGMHSEWYGARERENLQGGFFGRGHWGRLTGGRHGDICDGLQGFAGGSPFP